MSPLSKVLADLRGKRNLRQKDFASKLGYEQSYISALEAGTKGPPTKEFMAKLECVLSLNQAELEELQSAFIKSNRKLVVPIDAPESLYELCYELRLAIEQLLPSQIELMLRIIKLPDAMALENEKRISIKKY